MRLPCFFFGIHLVRSTGDVEHGQILACKSEHCRLTEGRVNVTIDGAVRIKSTQLAAAMQGRPITAFRVDRGAIRDTVFGGHICENPAVRNRAALLLVIEQ